MVVVIVVVVMVVVTVLVVVMVRAVGMDSGCGSVVLAPSLTVVVG